MRRYHAMLVEPWDGPAGLVFTDGDVAGAKLDRNGLRPLRVAVADDGLVVVSSEAGAVPLPEGVSVRRARLGPGQLLVGRSRPRAALRRRARAGPGAPPAVRGLGRREPRARREGAPVAEPDGRPAARHALHGYTREELNVMLRPIAQAGQEPVYSMGDDAPIAPLAGRARPLASYFRQRFAQVTNPAIDHYRERTVMSVATLVGARAPLGTEGALPPLIALALVSRHAGRPRRARAGRDRRDVHRGGGPRPRGRPVADAAAELVEGGATSSALATATREATARRSRRCSPSPPSTPLTERGLRTRVLAARDERRGARHAHGREPRRLRRRRRSAPGSRSRPSPSSPRATRSAATARPPPRRSNALRALEDGVLKVMSKSGISDVASYRGARLFEAVGLDRRLCRRFFGGRLRDRRDRPRPPRARGPRPARGARGREVALENPGFYKFRKGGEPHATDPDVVERAPERRHGRARAREGGQGRAVRPLRALRHARRRAAADGAPRPARARARGRAGAARRGRAGRLDRPALLERRDVARRALGRGARDDRDRVQPAGRPLELRRGRRGPGAATATSATRGSSRSPRAASA